MRRTGFTLIELLVVIAIIAILAAILFPVFARAREKARQSSCLSNGKQIGLALMSYAQDYDESLPQSWVDADASGDGTSGVDYTWRGSVLAYCKNAQIFQCPSKKLSSPFGSFPDYGYNSGYGMNEVHWANAGSSCEPPAGQSLGSIQYPAQCVLLGETEGSQSFSNTDGADVHGVNSEFTKAAYPAFYRHNDGSNFVYCDGHSKWNKINNVKCATGNCEWSISGN